MAFEYGVDVAVAGAEGDQSPCFLARVMNEELFSSMTYVL